MSNFNNEILEDKSFRVNGWAEPEYLSKRKHIESSKLTDLRIDRTRIEPYSVSSVSEFIRIILDFKTPRLNPIYYRGHINANYLNIPLVMRNNFANEHIIFHEFCKRFPDDCGKQRNTFSRLALMQHYGLNTRLLDITEDPLAALYFACKPNVKFNDGKTYDNIWGMCFIISSTFLF